MVSCVRNICTRKLPKSGNWFSSYSRKCRGCFLGTQCSVPKRWSVLLLLFYNIALIIFVFWVCVNLLAYLTLL